MKRENTDHERRGSEGKERDNEYGVPDLVVFLRDLVYYRPRKLVLLFIGFFRFFNNLLGFLRWFKIV